MAEPIFIGKGTKKGTWNAFTNSGSLEAGANASTPTNPLFTGTSSSTTGRYHGNTNLTASVGDYWQVVKTGTTSVDGYAGWQQNDYIVFVTGAAGTGWRRLSYTDTVSSLVVGQVESQPLSNALISGSCTAPNWVTPKPPCGPFADNKMILFVSGTVANSSASFSGSYNFVHDYTTGRVGIGTSNPAKTLHVNGASGEVEFRLQSNDKYTSIIQKDNAELIIQNASAGDIIVYDSSAERMRIKNGGNIGIGVSDPDTKLEILNAGAQLKLSYDADSYGTIAVGSDSGLAIRTGESGDITLDPAGADVVADGNILPNADNTRSLGSPTIRWANVYTGDLHLRNDRGDWTVVEEEEFLCIVNNKTGKKYKMMMEEID